MDQVEREQVASIIRSFGVTETGRVVRALERLEKSSGEGDGVARAKAVISAWLVRQFDVDVVAADRILAIGRAAFVLSGANRASEDLFLDDDLPSHWRERITAAVPRPSPKALFGEMVEQELSPLPVLQPLARLLVEPNE